MAAKNTSREIFAYASWREVGEPILMGILRASISRGNEIFSFEYDKAWLKSEHAMGIDPDLQLYAGPQYLAEGKNNFGIFLDSSPDRWGRVLMRRREAAVARVEERKEKHLHESDYLLGVFDGHRMGGIRFKEHPDGDFLDNNRQMASPPWTSLRDLEHASTQLERDDVMDDPDYMKWLMMLIVPGSSLGGARPKASVVDPDGHLWIAKFPSINDNRNIGAWEIIANILAERSGIRVAESRAQKFLGNNHTFLTKRFDRTSEGDRIHFASAMTMLGYTDGVDFHQGVSYLEIVGFLEQNGADVDHDLEELWRRIVFNICISNVDDHLRNHGFLLTPKGWILSPAFDMNPIETGTGLKLNISENDNALDLQLALSVCEYFRLKKSRAEEIIKEIRHEVNQWRHLANQYQIGRAEQESMSRAFRVAEN
ncbi:MAG TPA: HipA domain-containing protein [Ohtaekwangia sp.]